MAEKPPHGQEQGADERKHPAAANIEDVITFRLQQLVAIGERAGFHWSERMFGLSLNEWRLLALVQAREPARAGDIADLLTMDKSQTSRVIKSLLGKGLLRDATDASDKRAVALKMTADGHTLYESMFAEVLRSNERVLDVLSVEEVQAFDATLNKLIDHSFDLLAMRLKREIKR